MSGLRTMMALAGATLLLGGACGADARGKAPGKASEKVSEKAGRGSDSARTETEHVVKPGETLNGIAYRAHVPRVLIEEANHLKPPYRVHAGQRLFLPRTRHHRVKPGETGFDISMRYGVPFSAIAVANGLPADAPLKPGQKLLIPTLIPPSGAPAPAASASAAPASGARTQAGPDAGRTADAATAPKAGESAKAPEFLWPVAGRVVRGFISRKQADHHDGLDIAAPAGTPVYASAAGEVIFAGEEPQSFGRLVVISHRGGWQSAYGFLGRLTVTKGDMVRAHERIGLVGRTGKAVRDELHFEIRKADKPIDPRDILPDRAETSRKRRESKTR